MPRALRFHVVATFRMAPKPCAKRSRNLIYVSRTLDDLGTIVADKQSTSRSQVTVGGKGETGGTQEYYESYTLDDGDSQQHLGMTAKNEDDQEDLFEEEITKVREDGWSDDEKASNAEHQSDDEGESREEIGSEEAESAIGDDVEGYEGGESMDYESGDDAKDEESSEDDDQCKRRRREITTSVS